MMVINQIYKRGISGNSVCFRAVGDLNFSRNIAKRICKHDNFSPLPQAKEIIGNASLSFFNLECNPVSEAKAEYSDSSMISPASFLHHLRKEFNIACIANNHSTDAGFNAFLDTITHLKAENFLVVGGGKDKYAADRVCVIEKQGIRFGILASADFVYGPHWKGNNATSKKPGISIYNPDKLIQKVQSHKREIDILICSIHTGLEFHHYPSPQLIKEARSIIMAGAHIVLIHHAHVRQGIELFEHGLIAYGLGNFVFDISQPYMQPSKASTDVGLIVDILVDKQGIIGYKFWLSKIKLNGKTELLTDLKAYYKLYNEQLEFNNRLSDYKFIQNEWNKVCKRYFQNFYYSVYEALKERKFVRLFQIILNMIRRENLRWILGLLGS